MNIHYTVSFPDPSTHYIEVEMSIGQIASKELHLSMPVWTPGSYLVREYARLIDTFSIERTDGRKVSFAKLDKNNWKVNTKGITAMTVRYSLYAFDPTVRTNFVDEDHATVIGAATFLYAKEGRELPLTVDFKPFRNWKDIATTLPTTGKSPWKRKAANYDELVDSPVEIGRLETHHFEAGGIPHTLSINGVSNMDARQVVEDLVKICNTATAMFGKHPCDHYLFMLLCTNDRYNGLEHLHCSLNQLPRWDFYPREKYIRSIGLLSHEYFHLWNVKRIRPAELASFDYDREVYTRQLWMVEGVTSYYDDLILLRSGVINTEEYLTLVAKMMTTVVNTKGNPFESVGQASFEAWVKYYRRHENSANSQVSYYTKGAMQVQVLNLMILKKTNGKHSFDDIMKELWKRYLKAPEKGFTEEEFQQIAEEVSGLSLTSFFKNYIFGTKDLDYSKYFAYAGIKVSNLNEDREGTQIGMDALYKSGKLKVTKVERDMAAWKSGLNVHDEIVAIDGFRTTKLWQQLYAGKQPGDVIELTISRGGRLRTLKVCLEAWQTPSFELTLKKTPTAMAEKIRKKWWGK